MKRQVISEKMFNTDIFKLWKDDWLLLTSGDYPKGKFNCMTVAWGSIGVMWNRPFVQVVVRPTRYTFEFMEKYGTFTLSAFSEKYKEDLSYLGSRSGRNEDKLKKTKLTPAASEKADSPCYEEAELVIECRKIYASEFRPSEFLDPSIIKNYQENDYHKVYFGEVLLISGTDSYMSK
ncbi:MAG TPA: flavin reductase [Clostridiales bacterium]|mgnify:CR=1 FL=1|nr:flavin reductase [Clostridiales bacterium]HQP70207.1 flavin reductase [Clostridiales bacterium]